VVEGRNDGSYCDSVSTVVWICTDVFGDGTGVECVTSSRGVVDRADQLGPDVRLGVSAQTAWSIGRSIIGVDVEHPLEGAVAQPYVVTGLDGVECQDDETGDDGRSYVAMEGAARASDCV